nr:sensor histidine kinase [Odoribacter sp.]
MRKKRIIILGVVLGFSLMGLIFMQARYFQTAFKLKKAQFDYTVNRSLTEVVAYIDKQNEIREGEEKQQTEEKGADSKGKYKKISIGNDGQIVPNQILNLIDYDETQLNGGEFLGQKNNTGFQTSLLKFRQAIKEQLGTDFDLVLAKKFSEPERTAEERLKGINIENIIAERLQNNGIKADFEFAVKEKDRFIVMSQCFFNKHSDYTYTRKMFFGKNRGLATLYLIFPDRMQDTLSSLLLL